MSNFKTNLKIIPIELFKKVETLLSEYGLGDVTVTGVDITSNREPTNEELRAQGCPSGKKLKCKFKANGKLKCWCVDK